MSPVCRIFVEEPLEKPQPKAEPQPFVLMFRHGIASKLLNSSMPVILGQMEKWFITDMFIYFLFIIQPLATPLLAMNVILGYTRKTVNTRAAENSCKSFTFTLKCCES